MCDGVDEYSVGHGFGNDVCEIDFEEIGASYDSVAIYVSDLNEDQEDQGDEIDDGDKDSESCGLFVERSVIDSGRCEGVL